MARSRSAKKRRGEGVGGAREALPALSSLEDVPTYASLRASEGQHRAFAEVRDALVREEGIPEGELALGCVVRLDRGFPAVATPMQLVRAEFAAQLTKGAFSRAAVGDWVCVRVPEGHDMALIQAILPRESDIARWRGGARGERQTLAANVDVVLVCQALGATPPSCDRIARSAVIARDSGAEVALVLTKADRAGVAGVREAIAGVRAVVGADVPMAVTAAGAGRSDDTDSDMVIAEVAEDAKVAEIAEAVRAAGVGWGADAVRALVPEGRVGIVLGESGAGKSTLLNELLERETLETGTVRARDDAGRHTTVARRMVRLPGAGVIVDEPGLRSLPLVGHERGLALVFPEIAQASRGCRFRDCTHTHEPGCEVRAARAAGAFGAARLAAYLALAGEMRTSAASLDPDVVL